MTLEESIIGGAVAGGVKAIAEAVTARPRGKPRELQDRLDLAQAETLLLKAELRVALLREAERLLPEAIAQAKNKPAAKGKAAQRGSPALLRLISGMVFRNIAQDTKGKK